MDFKKNLQVFYREFEDFCQKKGRDPKNIKVLFATKYLTAGQLVGFLEIAFEYFPLSFSIGENRVQEAEEKFDYVSKMKPEFLCSFTKIMIGTLQKNKINKAIKIFDEIHSVDSLDLAYALDKRLAREKKIMPVFLEVNISGEKSKHGVKPVELKDCLRSFGLLKRLKLEGLMTMAPYFEDAEMTRPIFRTLRELADRYGLQTSMGMSHDWRVAVEEGADIIRIGSAVFKP